MKDYKPNRETVPNPAKLMESLRHTGYNNYSAIADIIDNSIDAEESQNIWVEVHLEKGDFVIKVIDDGTGMDEETLAEALKLGSETEKNIDSDLGRFGMGLCTAGLSMSRKTTVLTKQKDGVLLIGNNDLDWIIEHRAFKSYVGLAGEEEIDIFNTLTHKSPQGTVVIFSNSDRIQNMNVTVFANTLKKEIGRIFRRFIEAGRKYYVNGDLVPLIDPLMLSEAARVYSDEEYPIKIEGSKGTIEDSVRVRLVLLPDFGQMGNQDKGINYQNQGFYIMRNERELFAAETLNVYTKDPHLNRFRGEICFSGTLDEMMGVHFTKRSLSMSQGLTDKIREITRSQIANLRRIADEERPKAEKEISHADSEKMISKKSKLLIKPTPEIETDRVKREKMKQIDRKKTKEPGKEEPLERLKRICRFEESKMERVGPLYYPYMEGSKVVVRWNTDHPFYAGVLVPKKDDKTFVTAIDFLVYSLASAELKSRSDENISLFENIRSDMSTNLRVLLD